MKRDDKRFRLMSTFKSDLIKAEEAYLRMCQWECVDNEDLLTIWKTPEFTQTYTRNHAVQICKARDQELGYW